MVIRLVIVFCSLFSLCAWPYSIVFVHLGESVPNCIFTTMKQARYLNQECDIYLLADKKAHGVFQNRGDFFAGERISLIETSFVPAMREHELFQELNRIDPSISNGLWLYAIERFFTLFDFINERDLKEVVHLESDTMLYVDLNELLPLFKQLNARLAAPFESLVRCIPSFVFIKDHQSLAPLIHKILSEMKSYTGTSPHRALNDMLLLANFYREFGEPFMIPLPTLMPEYGRHYPKKKSHFSLDNGTPLSFLSRNASLFPTYIFDASALGIFVNGNDRRYSQHGPGTVHSRSLFDPGLFSFFWKNAFPFLSLKEKNYRIVNLHFHSKLPEDYTSFGEVRRAFFSRKKI